MIKTVRIWNGERPMALVTVDDETGAVRFASGAEVMFASGAAWSAETIDIELDPWAGIVVGAAWRAPIPPAT
jgi:hypothetical protein